MFTAGLGEPLWTDVELQTPTTLQYAMSLARTYERRTALPTDAALSKPLLQQSHVAVPPPQQCHGNTHQAGGSCQAAVQASHNGGDGRQARQRGMLLLPREIYW
jgi:hypothetical protein